MDENTFYFWIYCSVSKSCLWISPMCCFTVSHNLKNSNCWEKASRTYMHNYGRNLTSFIAWLPEWRGSRNYLGWKNKVPLSASLLLQPFIAHHCHRSTQCSEIQLTLWRRSGRLLAAVSQEEGWSWLRKGEIRDWEIGSKIRSREEKRRESGQMRIGSIVRGFFLT